MTEQQAYFEFRPGTARYWWNKQPPSRNKLFEKELARLGGLNTFGEPVLRVDWAGTLLSDTAFKSTLKFKKLWRGMVGFEYKDENGESKTVFREDDAPKGSILAPVYKTIELGRLRWVISKWQSIDEAIAHGRFSDQKDAEGGRLFRDPPSRGVYNAFMFVETADGKFRDLDMEVLNAVKSIWHYNENTPIDKKMVDLEKDEKQARKDSNAAALAQWM